MRNMLLVLLSLFCGTVRAQSNINGSIDSVGDHAPPEQPHRGDFMRHRFENVHDIFLRDSKAGLIARITISAHVSLSESWAHLNEPDAGPAIAGPHNRRIVEARSGFFVSSYGTNSELKPTKNIQLLVKELQDNNGLLKEPANKESKGVIAFEDAGFEAAFRERLKNSKAIITFQSGH